MIRGLEPGPVFAVLTIDILWTKAEPFAVAHALGLRDQLNDVEHEWSELAHDAGADPDLDELENALRDIDASDDAVRDVRDDGDTHDLAVADDESRNFADDIDREKAPAGTTVTLDPHHFA